jgi:hypothetical protein
MGEPYPQPEQANGHKEVKTLRVTLRSGKPFNMPADVAQDIIERYARDHPKQFGRHLNIALMGEET